MLRGGPGHFLTPVKQAGVEPRSCGVSRGPRGILTRGPEAFAELGYEGGSARELARRLGVSHNFINDRYGSKAAFRRAVVDHALGGRVVSPAHSDPSLDDAEQLRLIIAGLYLGAVDTPPVGRVLVDEFSRDTERLDYLYEHYISQTLQLMAPSIERLIAAGRMVPIPMDVLFFAVVPPVSGMLDGPLARRLGREDPASPEQLTATAEWLSRLVVNGLLETGA
jgi:AcrR family transcriptional regulator